MAIKKDKNVVELRPINIDTNTIYIEGTGDLCLNKMNARSTRALVAKQDGKGTLKEEPNFWEDLITSLWWRDELPKDDLYKKADEKLYNKLMKENAPCITAFGLKKSFCSAVVRNEIDTYSTKFDNAVNIIANNGLVPIEFKTLRIDERLMSPKKGSPVLVRIQHFNHWTAHFDISYTTTVYSLEQIVNIINLAGFGIGVGSGRTSGFGRFKVVDIK